MDWRQLWMVAIGNEPPIHHLSPIAGSIAFYTLVILFCILLQKLTKAILPKFLQEFVLDFILAMEVCTFPYQNGIMKYYYGNVGYFCIAIFVCFVVCYTWHQDSSPSLISSLHAYYSGKAPLGKTMLKVMLQGIAGIAGYQLARFVWMLDLQMDHNMKLNQRECFTDLHVPLLVGFLLEMSATMFDLWFGLQAISRFPFLNNFVKFAEGAILVIVGIHLTGMYMSPALATGMNFGCKGINAAEHFFVYWIGPILGGFIAFHANKYFVLENLYSRFWHDKKKSLCPDRMFDKPLRNSDHAKKLSYFNDGQKNVSVTIGDQHIENNSVASNGLVMSPNKRNSKKKARKRPIRKARKS